MHHTKLVSALAVSAALGASGTAFAAGKGDFLVRGGIAHVSPTDESENVGGVVAEVQSGTAVGLTAAYFITDNIAVELLASTPFSHDIEGKEAIDGADVGTTRHLPPTLSLQYHLQLGMPLRPYAGIGVNFTRFFDDDLEQDARALGFNDIDLENSWGVAFQLGADYEFTPQWLLNVGVRYIDIDSDARLNSTNAADPDLELEVELDPVVFELGIGYVF